MLLTVDGRKAYDETAGQLSLVDVVNLKALVTLMAHHTSALDKAATAWLENRGYRSMSPETMQRYFRHHGYID